MHTNFLNRRCLSASRRQEGGTYRMQIVAVRSDCDDMWTRPALCGVHVGPARQIKMRLCRTDRQDPPAQYIDASQRMAGGIEPAGPCDKLSPQKKPHRTAGGCLSLFSPSHQVQSSLDQHTTFRYAFRSGPLENFCAACGRTKDQVFLTADSVHCKRQTGPCTRGKGVVKVMPNIASQCLGT